MRTGIFVYADTIDYVLSPEIPHVVKYTGPGSSTPIPTKGGTVTLTKGIYRLITDRPTEIRMADGISGDHEIVIITDNKDTWPDPPAALVTAFPEVSAADLQAFFPAAFGGFDSPAAPAAGAPGRRVTG